jgi:hypothetical protein
VGKETKLELVDSMDYEEGSESISDCQVGRDEDSRLSEGLMDSEVISIQKGLLMKMGSVDLIVCQESSRSIPYCQVGRDEQMRLSVGLMNSEVSWNLPGEMTEQVSLEMNLDQQEQLTEEDNLRSLMMIRGIGVFLPFSKKEAEICVADGAAIAEEQSAEIVREELE